jgi:hypothetical protein
MSILAAEAGQILSKVFGAVNFSAEATWYVALRAAGTELTGGSYARVAVTNNTTNFPTVATNEIVNGVAITFPQATADWTTADEVALYVASSGGTAKYVGSLDNPVTVRTGQTRQFAAGDFKVRLQ